jgi:hypothetical protein
MLETSLLLSSRFRNPVKPGLLIIPKRFTESVFDLPPVEVKVGKGKYLVEVCRNGKVIRRPFGSKMLSNLITNAMFDYWGGGYANGTVFGSGIQNARCGTGTTTPANTDLQLTGQPANGGYTNSLFTGSGTSSSNDTVNGGVNFTFVYEFPAVTAGITLNEAGLSYSTTGAITGNSAINTHLLFPSGVVCNSGDNLRLTYSISLLFPNTVTAIPVSMSAVNGFNPSGSIWSTGTFASIIGSAIAGQTTVIANMAPIQAIFFGSYANYSTALCSGPTTPPTVNTAFTETLISGANVAATLGTYTNGNYYRTWVSQFAPSVPSSTVNNVNLVRLFGNAGTAIYLFLSAAQTKANTNTLTFNCQVNYGRI